MKDFDQLISELDDTLDESHFGDILLYPNDVDFSFSNSLQGIYREERISGVKYRAKSEQSGTSSSEGAA